MDQQTALEAVYDCLDQVNELRPQNDKIEKSPDFPLAGEGGRLDSLALTTLLLGVERRVAEIAGKEIVLLDETELGAMLDHLATPSALATFVVKKSAA